MRHRVRLRRFVPVLTLVALLTATLAACGSEPVLPTPEPTPLPGDIEVTLTSSDGTELAARYWLRDDERILIYFHEYLSDQSKWWPHIDAASVSSPSALTLDFRGHGGSEGLPDEYAGMVEDARAAIAFARERGFEQIVLMGSGMGAAVAMVVAAENPNLYVVGLSAPSMFTEEIVPLQDAVQLGDRLALVATEGDLSAAHSLEQFVESTGLPRDHWRLFEGRAHGVEMIESEESEEIREYLGRMLEDAWRRQAESSTQRSSRRTR